MSRNSESMLSMIVLLLVPFTSSLRGANPDTLSPRVVEITAKRFEFTPNQITLKKGETVKLVLHSEDVTHGFFMRALKLDEEIEAGKTRELLVTPQVTGSFTTICHHFCGVNHGNMKMTVVVE